MNYVVDLLDFWKSERARLKACMDSAVEVEDKPWYCEKLVATAFYLKADSIVTRLNQIHELETIGFAFHRKVAQGIREEFKIRS